MAQKILVIAEKPDMGRKIASALTGPVKNGQGCVYTADATVSWGIGHLLELAMPEEYDEKYKKFSWENLPFIPEKFIVKVTKEKSSQFKILKDLINSHDIIVNAGDPGREGQLIVDEILTYLRCKKPVKRLLLPELRPSAIQKAWAQMEDNIKYHNLYLAGLARGYADYLTGLNGTPAFTLLGQSKGYKGLLSVGRVQSPTLAIVVNRDKEIENFIPKDYYVVTAPINSPGKKPEKFNSTFKPNKEKDFNFIDEEGRLISKEKAQELINLCSNKPAKVIKYEIKDGLENPPLPFSLSKLQSFINSKFSLGAKEILDSCQSLYEKHEAQSYPRSDCQYLPEAAHSDAKNVLSAILKAWPEFQNIINNANVNIKHSCFNDSKLTDHYAIIPTVVSPNINNLSEKEKKVYKTVCQRYIAQFYPACKFKTATIELEIEGQIFKATGKVITEPGWKQVYSGETKDINEQENEEDNQSLPELTVGEILSSGQLISQLKQTKPPARFTEGSLIEAMANVHTLVSDPQKKAILKDKKGIGREATRTQIIDNLIKRNLLLKDGKKLISSQGARALINALPTKIVDPALTAVWEDALDKIAEGKITLDNFMSKQKEWIIQMIQIAKTTDIKIDGSMYAKKTENIQSQNSNSNSKPYPKKTSTSTSIKKPIFSKEELNDGDTCPNCKKGKMVKRVAKASGKEFLGCNNFPKCNFLHWPKN